MQNANTFKDTAKVLRMTRTGVAWFAVGCQMGAYEHALRYATERMQFGKPIGGFQLVQDLLVRMLGNVTSTQTMMLRLAQLQDEGLMQDEHASLAKAFCTSNAEKRSAMPANCSAATVSCSTTISAALSPTRRQSARMRTRER